MPGYRLGAIPIDAQMTKDVALTAFQARALYAPSAVFEGSGRLDAMLDLVDQTEVNAMVIDVKEAGGNLYWATDLPAAAAVGSIMEHPLLQLDELLPKLKARGIYTIARMVVMKDNTLGKARPELAVSNTATGEPWRDYRGGIWLDPVQPRGRRVHRRPRRRPGRQGLRRGAARLRPLLQRRRLLGRRHEPAEHAVVPAAGHPTPLPARLATRS